MRTSSCMLVPSFFLSIGLQPYWCRWVLRLYTEWHFQYSIPSFSSDCLHKTFWIVCFFATSTGHHHIMMKRAYFKRLKFLKSSAWLLFFITFGFLPTDRYLMDTHQKLNWSTTEDYLITQSFSLLNTWSHTITEHSFCSLFSSSMN